MQQRASEAHEIPRASECARDGSRRTAQHGSPRRAHARRRRSTDRVPVSPAAGRRPSSPTLSSSVKCSAGQCNRQRECPADRRRRRHRVLAARGPAAALFERRHDRQRIEQVMTDRIWSGVRSRSGCGRGSSAAAARRTRLSCSTGWHRAGPRRVRPRPPPGRSWRNHDLRPQAPPPPALVESLDVHQQERDRGRCHSRHARGLPDRFRTMRLQLLPHFDRQAAHRVVVELAPGCASISCDSWRRTSSSWRAM